MCHWDMIKYTCECVKYMGLFQCAARQGTNVECKPIRKVLRRQSTNYCPGHLVNPDAAQRDFPDPDGA